MAALLLLPGCTEAREMFGFSREGPDEFAIITHQPLVIPPDFDLRPPSPQQAAVERDKARETAEEALFSQPETDSPADGLTAGEEALLQQLGATTSQDALADIATEEAGDSVVDARAEAERLRANEEAGAAPTQGPTPTIEDESNRSILDEFWDLF